MESAPIQFIEGPGGRRLAYRRGRDAGATVVFLPGYMSDMEGAKAVAVDAFATARGLSCVRFDYSGTGASDGNFADGRLDRWLEDSLAIVDRLAEGPVILAGSSMGGWLALHIALVRPTRVKAIVGIAAAPDFTDWGFLQADRDRLQRDGRIEERQADDAPGRLFTRTFWESGQRMLLLGSQIPVDCPVRLIHGEADADVPLEVGFRTLRQLRSADVQLTVVKGGGHRLSAPHEIETILHVFAGLLETVQ